MCFKYGIKRKDEIEAEEAAQREKEQVGRLGRAQKPSMEEAMQEEDEESKTYLN